MPAAPDFSKLPKAPADARHQTYTVLSPWLREVAKAGGRPALRHVWQDGVWPGTDRQRGHLTSLYLELLAEAERRELGLVA